VVNTLVSINVVALHWARILLGWGDRLSGKFSYVLFFPSRIVAYGKLEGKALGTLLLHS